MVEMHQMQIMKEMEGKSHFMAIPQKTRLAAEILGFTSKAFGYAVEHVQPRKSRLHVYYKIQSLQSLGERNNQVSVPIWIAQDQSRYPERLNVASAWIEHIHQAIKDINYAAPGLGLFITSDASKAIININGLPRSENSCYTIGDILTHPDRPVAEIYLNPLWGDKKRTSCHELLHALGFQHEHKRRDRDSSVHVQDVEREWKSQYSMADDQLGITRFDPFSIMMYPEDQEYLRRNSEDPVWFTKPTTEINREMSELDKVGLNNLYRPCRGPHYSPTRFGRGITGLWYCGRNFGVQSPGSDGCCGPTNGPNCPACRVLRCDRVESLWKKGKWQGWTGQVYCGRYFGVQKQGHDGYCGPNNGLSCPECYNELLRGN